ncbi:putative elongation of very long chain fatty acids protein 6-like [Apostichopus japonicus]|uniref:Elongation of very long chain fatty acids protein n=1 Tax=Stichopus japonicus TaxID=307972 RepID=A0A2G8LJX1_STIJA|nr:putative elongation of very long chain fatty acids protein 6-like [Apostichopus japonicus]
MLEHLDPIFQQTIFPFEEDFDHRPWLEWFHKYWKISALASVIYVIVIFSIKRIMRDRQPFGLRSALVLWSLALAVFSTVCAMRLWRELFRYQGIFGWKATMCDAEIGYSGVNGFWSLLFVLSKLPELGDTLFVVLRKQPLIFLHWYHHITVLMYSFYSYEMLVAPGRYFILMNSSVHSIMYSYYAIKASRIVRIPKWINICITLIQISQMVVGVIVNLLAYHYRSNGEFCSTADSNITVAMLMYASYFVLFANYFFQAYLAKRSKAVSKREQNGNVYTNGISYTNGTSVANGHASNGASSLSNGHVTTNGSHSNGSAKVDKTD